MTDTRTCRIRWSNGSVSAAADWQSLLDAVRLQQWHTWTEEEFRLVLAKRAMRWSGTDIDYAAEPEDLFMELHRARLVEVLGPNDDDKEE